MAQDRLSDQLLKEAQRRLINVQDQRVGRERSILKRTIQRIERILLLGRKEEAPKGPRRTS